MEGGRRSEEKVVRREAEENEVVGCEFAGLAMLASRVSDIRVRELEGEWGAGGEAKEKLERGGSGGGGREVVVGELGNVEEGGPVVLVEGDKVLEVLF